MGGYSAVGGMAVFAEQNVHLGRGPSAVGVICVARGSGHTRQTIYRARMGQTQTKKQR
jgi:hypothetical protein